MNFHELIDGIFSQKFLNTINNFLHIVNTQLNYFYNHHIFFIYSIEIALVLSIFLNLYNSFDAIHIIFGYEEPIPIIILSIINNFSIAFINAYSIILCFVSIFLSLNDFIKAITMCLCAIGGSEIVNKVPIWITDGIVDTISNIRNLNNSKSNVFEISFKNLGGIFVKDDDDKIIENTLFTPTEFIKEYDLFKEQVRKLDNKDRIKYLMNYCKMNINEKEYNYLVMLKNINDKEKLRNEMTNN